MSLPKAAQTKALLCTNSSVLVFSMLYNHISQNYLDCLKDIYAVGEQIWPLGPSLPFPALKCMGRNSSCTGNCLDMK